MECHDPLGDGNFGIENIDPTELKRQKARERYASMTEEQKALRNAKRRANYHRKKVESLPSNMAPETFSSNPVQLATNRPRETPVVFHPLGEGVAVQDIQLQKNYKNTSLHDFIFVEPTIEKQALAGTDLCTEEIKRKRERDRYSNISELAIHEKILKIQNIRRHIKEAVQASNPINRGEQGYSSETAIVGTSKTAVTEVFTRSKTRRAINGMNIDSGDMVNHLEPCIWEPDNPNVTCEEEDLECFDPKEGEPDIYEDDESRVFHERDFRYEMTRDPNVVVQEHDPCDAIYQNLPKSHHILRYDEILDHVLSKRGRIFFVDGPGGTRKTYLYKALLAKVRSMNLIAIATATSGIAAAIMPGGRTAHSRFEIPIKIKDNSLCKFSKQSGTAALLRTASLIIWDEVAMTRRQAVETLDRSLQDIMECSEPFGGKVMVFGGDFRQVLPVVPRGTRAQITDATLQRSYIWEKIKKIQLKQNMRAQSDILYSNFLLRIGNGTEGTDKNDYVKLPEDIVIEYDSEKSLDTLIDRVFPDLRSNYTSTSYMSERAILSTRNEHVDAINARMIDMFPGEEKVYFSHDSVDDDTTNNYPLDFLNSITPNALPPHVLKVKKNCPVILLRNLDPHNGLCNGTRLVVRGFQNNAIDAEIFNGQYAGNRVFLPRIPLSPSEDITLPFKFKRKQFPIRLSFAMTINKAQGQTIPNVGIYLPEPVFSHGQLYVALSRGVSRKTTWVLAKPNNNVDTTGKTTKNIVYKDVLEA